MQTRPLVVHAACLERPTSAVQKPLAACGAISWLPFTYCLDLLIDLQAFAAAAPLPTAPQCAFPAIGFAGTLEYGSKGPCTAPSSPSQQMLQWPSVSLMDNCLPLYGRGPGLFEP